MTAGFLRRCNDRGHRSIWCARERQYRSELAIHQQSWTDLLVGAKVRISMDGKGRWIDNVFIELLWRSIKYEDI